MKTNNKKKIELFALVAGVIQPLLTLPQIIEIYDDRSAQDVSLATWLGYLIIGITFLVYGLAFKLRPIIVTQSIWIVMQTIVVIGIFMYR